MRMCWAVGKPKANCTSHLVGISKELSVYLASQHLLPNNPQNLLFWLMRSGRWWTMQRNGLNPEVLSDIMKFMASRNTVLLLTGIFPTKTWTAQRPKHLQMWRWRPGLLEGVADVGRSNHQQPHAQSWLVPMAGWQRIAGG